MHQRIQKTPWLLLSVLLFILSAGFPFYALAQDPTATPTIDSATAGLEGFEEAQGMTLFELLKAGSWVMMILIALSALALGLAIYYALTLSEKKLIPSETVTQIRHYLRDRRYEDIARLCRRSKGMFSKIIVAGISRGMIEPTAAASTMETVGRRESEALMRKVRYLSDIATVAPMLGLLGTVLGMINAFNFIAFDISAVKPVALASAVAQALVTTAAGLIVAIPSMGLFFYFRGKLQSLISRMEEVAAEISDQLTLIEKKPAAATKSSRRKTPARPTKKEKNELSRTKQ